MKEGVKWPWIPYEEYRLRIHNAKEIIAKHGMEAMLLFSPASWWYYAGWTDVSQMHGADWRSAVIVCRDRDPVAIVHAVYAKYSIPLTSYVEDVRSWSEEPSSGLPLSFWSLLFDTLSNLGLTNRTIGLETGPNINTNLSFDEYKVLLENLPRAKVISADKAIFEQRMIKTPWEIETIREGCRRACTAVREAFEAIKPGVNELDVHRAYWKSCAEHDLLSSPNESTWVLFTSNSEEVGGIRRGVTHPVDRVIEIGDQGMCDFGPTYKGYKLDFQRSFCVGEPPKKQLRYNTIAKEALLETMACIKPGIRVCDIYEVSVDAVKKRDPNQVSVYDFAGHSMGLYSHEPPWIRADEKTVVEPGMVFCIEVAAFDPDREVVGGYPEDIVLVTEDGIENFTRFLLLDLWIAN